MSIDRRTWRVAVGLLAGLGLGLGLGLVVSVAI